MALNDDLNDLNPDVKYAVIEITAYNVLNEGKREIIIQGKIDSIIWFFSSNKEEDFELKNILEK